jgi:hypothetical protein
VREFASFTITAHGQPGDAVYLWLTPQTDFRWVPTYLGVQLARVTDRPRFFGTIGASGALTRNWSWGELGPGVECSNVYLQAALRDATGQYAFSSLVSLIVLDSSF